MSATQGLLNQVEDAIASGSVARRGKPVRHVTDLFIVSSPQCTESEIALLAAGLSWLGMRATLAARATGRPNASGEILLASYERLKPATAQEIVRFHRARRQAAEKPTA